MASYQKLLLLAATLIVLGIGSFLLQPGEPEAQCATGKVTSGFVDEEKGCPISVASMREIGDYISSPKPFRIAGLVLCVGGVVVGVVGLVKLARAPKRSV